MVVCRRSAECGSAEALLLDKSVVVYVRAGKSTGERSEFKTATWLLDLLMYRYMACRRGHTCAPHSSRVLTCIRTTPSPHGCQHHITSHAGSALQSHAGSCLSSLPFQQLHTRNTRTDHHEDVVGHGRREFWPSVRSCERAWLSCVLPLEGGGD